LTKERRKEENRENQGKEEKKGRRIALLSFHPYSMKKKGVHGVWVLREGVG